MAHIILRKFVFPYAMNTILTDSMWQVIFRLQYFNFTLNF